MSNIVPNITLYKFDSCPFCQVVMKYIQDRNLSIETKDTLMNPANKAELIQIGGKAQVPCLVINGNALYESQDIISWLETNA